jgi:hypothetical protein
MFSPLLAHIAGVPVEEILQPLIATGGVGLMAALWLPKRFRRPRKHPASAGDPVAETVAPEAPVNSP